MGFFKSAASRACCLSPPPTPTTPMPAARLSARSSQETEKDSVYPPPPTPFVLRGFGSFADLTITKSKAGLESLHVPQAQLSHALSTGGITRGYGGLSFDFGKRTWRAATAVGADGKAERTLMDDTEKNTDAIAKAALASGRLYIRVPDLDQLHVISGFFVNNRYFVTGSEELVAGNTNVLPADLMATDSGIAFVSQESECRSDEIPKSATPMRLFHSSKLFSVFVPDLPPHAAEDFKPKASLKINDLIGAEELPYDDWTGTSAHHWANKKIFSAGYNAVNKSQGFTRYVKSYMNSLSFKEKEIMKDCFANTSSIEFERYFKIDQRSVGVGSLPPMDEQKGNTEEGSDTVWKWKHTVPMWSGAEGSLVGFLDDDRVRIFGILTGGKHTSKFNDMVCFTQENLETLKDVMAGHRKSMFEM